MYNTPPNMSMQVHTSFFTYSYHIPRCKVGPGRAACCSRPRRLPRRRMRRRAARQATADGRWAGGSRLCARCLCTPLRAIPPHHYILRSSTYVSPKEFLPRRHCECEVPSLGRFSTKVRRVGWASVGRLLLRLRTQASPDVCGRRLQAGRPREEMIGCSI